MNRNRNMALPSPYDRSPKTELDILRRFETDFFNVDPRTIRRGVPFQTAHGKLIAERPRESREKRNTQRLNAIDLKGIDILRVIAPQKAATLGWPKPMIAFPNRKHMVPPDIRSVSFDDPKVICRRNRPSGNRVLSGIVHERDAIDVRQQCAQFIRIPSRTRSMLIFPAKIQSKPSILAAPAEAGYIVEAFRIRPAIVVDDGLPKVKAITQRSACDAQRASIGTLKQHIRLARPVILLNIRFQFPLQGMKDLAGF